MKTDTAVVMSFYEHDAPGALRINLKWGGEHEVSDFSLDWLGEVLDYETEREGTGWVTVKPRGAFNIGGAIALKGARWNREELAAAVSDYHD